MSTPYPPYGSRLTFTDQQRPDGALVAVAWVLAVLTSLYMLPWAVAVTRGKANHVTVLLVDLFLGWTLVGWVIALVMACGAHRPLAHGVVPAMPVGMLPAAVRPAPTARPAAPGGWYPNPAGPGEQYWDGEAWTGHVRP